MGEPTESIQRRIDHQLAELEKLETAHAQLLGRLQIELQAPRESTVQSFVTEFSKLETQRASRRAVIAELEQLRVLVGSAQ